MRARLCQVLHTLRRDESGQSLIVIVSSMIVLLGMAGFGIDAATWMVRHHNTQVVADAAALAAAQCLADPGQAAPMYVNGTQEASVATCGDSTDINSAQKVAVAYAAANGLTIYTSDVNVDTTKDIVTVTAPTTAPAIFAKVLGMGTVQESAQAGAGWKTGGGSCTNAGSNCDFMFANSNDCSGVSLNVGVQGAATIDGIIQTNGGLEASETGNGGGIYGASSTYGPGACTSTISGNHDPWKTSAPTQASSLLTWPIDYSKDFPACGGSGDPCSTGVFTDGYPSYCTNVGQNINLGNANGQPPASGNVYCASGPDGNPADPSTWDGKITLDMSGNNPIEDTFVAQTISYIGKGGDTISPCGYTPTGFSSSSCAVPAPAGDTTNYPIFYATGADPNPSECAAGQSVDSTCAFSMSSNGNLTLTGDTFVPNGTVSLNLQGNQETASAFFEGNVITAALKGKFGGDGPSPSGVGGGNQGGTVTLVQ